MPESADSSSSSSSSSESPTDRDGICGCLFGYPEVQRRRRGGPVTPDFTTWDFKKADCRTKCRKLVENSVDDGGGDKEQAWAVLHWAFICELYEITVAQSTVLSSHTFTFRRQLESGNNSGRHEQVPRHVPDSGRQLLDWPEEPWERV